MTDERESNLSEIPTGSAMTDEARERADFETWYYACNQVPFGKPYAYTVGPFTGAYEDWKSIRAPLLARIAELEAQVATERDDALEEAAAIASACAQEYRRDRDHGEAYAANCIARNIRALKSHTGATP